MGVPSFYRWLVRKYPKIVVNAIEEESVKVDSSLRNPNEPEFDNFYVDMNAIIHPCFHPDDALFPPTTFEEVFQNIYEYIDQLFNIVRPRKIFFLAIDGVAPRAKMNQQRARRFRTAKDKEIIEEEEQKLREKFKKEGKKVLEKQDSEVLDSNVITPGTLFMYTLSEKLQSYIRERISTNPAWKNIKVILSDSNVPGEGEHKIKSFIHAQRTFRDYNPNTRHCLYGLDADLIMLALASHELHFSVLREDVLVQEDQSNHLSSLTLSLQKAETHTVKSRGWFKMDEYSVIESDKENPFRAPKKQFQFLNIWVLREYLDLDIRADLPEDSKADLERVVDDFVFICFFAGNDFLPHMPTLEIHEGALDLLIYVYKKEFKNFGGYLVDMERVEDPRAGYIKLSRVEKFIRSVGTFEEKIFKKRMEIREKRIRRIMSQSRHDDEEEVDIENVVNQFDAVVSAGFDEDIQPDSNTQQTTDNSALRNTKDLKQKLKDIIRNNADIFRYGSSADKVKLGVPGWRERYYTEKFEVESHGDIEKTRKAVVARYTEGLHWVLLYYFKGVPSWNWFYPYHYGPFASDLKGMSQTKVNFQKGQPFKPFDQLMSVLPPGSAHALPDAYKTLMLDQNSNIIDFYPPDFKTDVDGKRFLWQGIIKLPFIDEGRLLIETRKLDKDLTDHDQKRNMETADQLYMESSCELALYISSSFKNNRGSQDNDAIKIDPALGLFTVQIFCDGVNGNVWHKNDHNNDLPRDALCVFYCTSPCSTSIPRVLAGTMFPEKIVCENDIAETVLWHDFHGRPASSCYRSQNQGSPGRLNNCQRDHRDFIPDVFVRGAGCGWAGRGEYFTESELQNHNNFPRYTSPRANVNARFHASSVPWERPGSSTAHYRQPITTPSNQWQMPRSPMAAPSRNTPRENLWRMPRPPVAARMQPIFAPTDNPWIRGNADFRNSGLENPRRMTIPAAAVPTDPGLVRWRSVTGNNLQPIFAPTDNPWIRGNAASRNSGLENLCQMTIPAAVVPTDPGWVRWRSVSGNNWQHNLSPRVQVHGRGGGQPSCNSQNKKR